VTPRNVAGASRAAGPEDGTFHRPGEQTALSSREHRRLADVLLGAARTGRAIAPFTAAIPELTVADAYRIRDMLLARRMIEGDKLIGAKVWLGGAAGERGHAAPDPQLGWLTDRMLVSGGVVDMSRLIRPRVEPRVGFLLARSLRKPIVAASELMAATECVLPCLEIVDSRYDGAPPRLADVIADNCGTGALLLGEGVRPPADGHLRRLRVQLDGDGAMYAPPGVRAHAVVAPLDAATWLANQLLKAAHRPQPGTLLLCPVAGGAVELLPGLHVTARFRGIGGVELLGTHRRERPGPAQPRAGPGPAGVR
jgi:2-keto-4-pentenoate hydratase